MKTLAQNLKQAIAALEFTSAGNLSALNAQLSALEPGIPSARLEQDGRHDDQLDSIAGSAAASH